MKKVISSAIILCAIIGTISCGEPKPATSTSPDSTMMENRVDSMEQAPAKPDTMQPQ